MTREPCGAKSVNEELPRLLPSNKDILSAISDSLGVSEKERKKKEKMSASRTLCKMWEAGISGTIFKTECVRDVLFFHRNYVKDHSLEI